MSTQEVFAEQEADELLMKDEVELTDLLALKVKAIQEDMSLSLKSTFEVQDFTLEVVLPPWIKDGYSMIATALRQSHNVLCSDLPEFSQFRGSLIGALGIGGSTAVIAIASFLTGTLGIAAALATVVATIVIKRLVVQA